jgi:hypothetical protein
MSEERNHINSEALKKYLSGSLNEAEQKQFEDAMDADSFEKEAFEGFNSIEDKAVLLTAVRSIEKSVADKTGLKQGRGFVFPGWKIISIAAAVAFLIVGTFFINQFMKSETLVAVNTSDVETESLPAPEVDMQPELLEVLEDEQEDFKVIEVQAQEMDDLEQGFGNLNEGKFNVPNEDNKSAIETTAVKPSPPSITYRNDSGMSEADQSVTSSLLKESADNYFDATDVQTMEKSESNTYNGGKSFFDIGMANYNAKDYDKALDCFQDAINNKSNLTEAEFYMAMSYDGLNKTNKALKYFDYVIAKPSSSLSNNAKWYKALIMEDKGATAEAIKLLQELANGNSAFKNQAQDKLNAFN